MSENIFLYELECEAINRIKHFAELANKMGCPPPVVGFSGGKDSQVVYDLCKRSGIKFTAKFNHCFESATTLQFIREHYPDVEWRRVIKQGFFDNIKKNHRGMFPTVEKAFCCADYKHNPKYIDAASIVGVRRSESASRSQRQVLETKNKTILKKNKDTLTEYFKESCIASGAPSEITLYPIVDWSDDDVWDYIKTHNLPINPEYKYNNRVGCIICPKANLDKNWRALVEHPKLIDCAIKCCKDQRKDWYIETDNKDYEHDKVYFICRWLNYSFRPFRKSHQEKYNLIRQKYEEYKSKTQKPEIL